MNNNFEILKNELVVIEFSGSKGKYIGQVMSIDPLELKITEEGYLSSVKRDNFPFILILERETKELRNKTLDLENEVYYSGLKRRGVNRPICLEEIRKLFN